MEHRIIKLMKKTKRNFIRHIINIPGWKTDRKLVIFESDDWGSIRMPSKKVYQNLLMLGDKVDSDPFTRYDSLAGEDDISLLLDILTMYKDYKGNYPIITANFAVANPNFDKIGASGYGEYYYEPFTETLKDYPEHKGSFELWQHGIKQKIFFPQFHCREHMNVMRWMKHLQEGKSDTVTAFRNRMISTGNSYTSVNKYAYMDAFNYDIQGEVSILKDVLKEGIELFKRVFDYSPKSFIAPCYIWSSDFEKELANNDFQYIQGSKIQFLPQKTEGTKTLGKKRHYTGQVNRYNQLYLIRNCRFEPSWNQDTDWVNNCLREIDIAFKWKKPAIISTHRLNYIGYIVKSNRDKNLRFLSLLLSQILGIWPDAEFITSVELGEIIRTELG